MIVKRLMTITVCMVGLQTKKKNFEIQKFDKLPQSYELDSYLTRNYLLQVMFRFENSRFPNENLSSTGQKS